MPLCVDPPLVERSSVRERWGPSHPVLLARATGGGPGNASAVRFGRRRHSAVAAEGGRTKRLRCGSDGGATHGVRWILDVLGREYADIAAVEAPHALDRSRLD